MYTDRPLLGRMLCKGTKNKHFRKPPTPPMDPTLEVRRDKGLGMSEKGGTFAPLCVASGEKSSASREGRLVAHECCV